MRVLALAVAAALVGQAHADPDGRPKPVDNNPLAKPGDNRPLPDKVDKAPTPISLDTLLARTDLVSREVSKVRGLPLKKLIPYEVVDKDELRRRLLKMAGEDKTKRETIAEGFALARWGMIPLATAY